MLKVGTDCSGIEAPIQALMNLGVDFEHMFSCDIDKYVRKSIEANYEPKILFEDITKDRVLPKLDLYVCGFSCQPFSMAGLRKGSEDSRGNIFQHCVKTILQTDTSIFILENVRGIMSVQNGDYFKFIKRQLSQLSDYNVSYSVLNTKDYGVPQNRKRLFIVGIKKSCSSRQFRVPEPMPCLAIESLIDYSDLTKRDYPNYLLKKFDKFKNTTFCNVEALRSNGSVLSGNVCNTVTCCGVWNIKLQRPATIKEHLALQGFPTTFKQVVSNCQMRKQIGNAMSVNVLECLLKECLDCLIKSNQE